MTLAHNRELVAFGRTHLAYIRNGRANESCYRAHYRSASTYYKMHTVVRYNSVTLSAHKAPIIVVRAARFLRLKGFIDNLIYFERAELSLSYLESMEISRAVF